VPPGQERWRVSVFRHGTLCPIARGTSPTHTGRKQGGLPLSRPELRWPFILRSPFYNLGPSETVRLMKSRLKSTCIKKGGRQYKSTPRSSDCNTVQLTTLLLSWQSAPRPGALEGLGLSPWHSLPDCPGKFSKPYGAQEGRTSTVTPRVEVALHTALTFL
jgi:hypothetical protein